MHRNTHCTKPIVFLHLRNSLQCSELALDALRFFRGTRIGRNGILAQCAIHHHGSTFFLSTFTSFFCPHDHGIPLSIHYRSIIDHTKSYFCLVNIGNTANSLYGLFVYHEISCALTRFCPHFAKDTSFFGGSQCRVMI